jgi:hypothetical protein
MLKIKKQTTIITKNHVKFCSYEIIIFFYLYCIFNLYYLKELKMGDKKIRNIGNANIWFTV